MIAHQATQLDANPYGRAGIPWWASALLGVMVLLPSTAILMLPALVMPSYLFTVALTAAFLGLLGTMGVVGATFQSLMCKAYGWWPIPAALIMQWVLGWVLYSNVM